jgi:Ca2+-transporting ATPase
MEGFQLKINESSLTGESIAVEKVTRILTKKNLTLGDQTNMAFNGTYITSGHGKGVVVTTGMLTEVGKIARLLQVKSTQTPLQKRLAVFGKNLAYIILFICGLVFIVGYLRGENVVLLLLTSLSLAVAAIPEALPAVITIALANGAKKMVKTHVLIRKLTAVETLGSVSFICTDKTGTLTLNKMMVEEIVVRDLARNENYSEKENLHEDYKVLLQAMALNNNVYQNENEISIGDPTEIALYDYALSKGFDKTALENEFPRLTEIPFDSHRKCMTTIHKRGGKYIVFVKGAIEVLMHKTQDGTDTIFWKNSLHGMLAKGLRVLGFAMKELNVLPSGTESTAIENNLELIGIAGLIDPPRQEAKQAVQQCKTAGIQPVMISGDHPTTAATIAKRLGIIESKADRIVTGAEMNEMDEKQLQNIVDHTKVYARVSPEQKLLIVKALQKKGEYVAMTGDGVNDAPALKRADIGVAMGITGTDVSKEAADMILLDDNFATIVKAVKEGRRIFDNIRKFIRYILTGNTAEILTIFLAPFFGLPIPLLPIHILWINLVTDGLPGLALATEPAEKNIMRRQPQHSGESVFANGLGVHIVWVGFLMAALTIGTQAYSIYIKDAHWQTMVFTVLCFGQLLYSIAIRSESESVFKQGLLSNSRLLVAVIFSFLLQFGIIYFPFFNKIFRTSPLELSELIFCIAMAFIVFFAVEIEKWTKRKARHQVFKAGY